nr:MAG TPA: hypothetical protein [Caudoviricetes sp.]
MKKTEKCKFTFIEKIKYYLFRIQSPSLLIGKCCYCERRDTCRYALRKIYVNSRKKDMDAGQ